MLIAQITQRRSKLYSWICKVQLLGCEPTVRVVEYCDSIASLDGAEIYWISHCRALGCPLTNITEGGRNGSWFAGEDEKRRRSESRMGKLHPMFGKTHRESTITKMKAAHVGRKWTPEQIERRAAKRRRPFMCVETGETFASIGDFVVRGHGSSAVKHVLNGHQETINGLHYRRIDP